MGGAILLVVIFSRVSLLSPALTDMFFNTYSLGASFINVAAVTPYCHHFVIEIRDYHLSFHFGV